MNLPSPSKSSDAASSPSFASGNRLPSLRHWALGGSALVGVAGGASSQAATVEVDLAGNGVSMANGLFASSLNLDLTGDGIDDFSSASLFGANLADPDGQGVSLRIGSYEARAFHGKKVYSWTYTTTSGKFERYKSTFTGFSLKVGYSSFVSYDPQELTGFIPVKFTDAGVNGGAESQGWVEVRVASTGIDDHAIELVKLIYDDASTGAPDLYGGGDSGGDGGDGGVIDGDGDVIVYDGDDGVILYDREGGPLPVYAFFTRGLGEKPPVPRHLPKAALLAKERLRARIDDLGRQVSAVERRLSALHRSAAKSKRSPRSNRFAARDLSSRGEADVLSRKRDGLRKKIRALRQRLRNL